MNLEQFKVFKFEKGKYYIVLFNPEFINIDSLQSIADYNELFGVTGIFIPCEDVDRGMKTVTFDSLEVLEEWVKQMKTTSSASS